jgi:hypothetical protein
MQRKLSTQGIFLAGVLIAILQLALSSWGQATINARISGGGGSGKCTFEIRTGGTAEVDIRGNQGRLRSINGTPVQWVRLDCNQSLPSNPNNFRFAGVDGRGKQYLLKNPNGNGGVAVIRIEDNRGGMEGYTGDIMWNGGTNTGGGGWGPMPPPPGSGQWNNRLVPNCQNNVRNKFNSQMRGASLNFVGAPSTKQAGAFVMVDGTANVRDNQGRMGQIAYHCTMHPNGNVADSSYNVTQGPGGPQPR